METIKIAKSAASDVSELTLNHAPPRALKFLQAATGDSEIHKVLVTEVGWSTATEKQGWALLARLSDASVATPASGPNEAASAMAACEKVQAITITRVRTVLETTHPDQAQFLFHDYVGGKGTQAVFNLATFVRRCHQLAHDPERKASRKIDAEALKIIEETSKESLRELAALVDAAQSGAIVPESPSSGPERQAKRVETLRNIYAWFTMWSGLAHTTSLGRLQLIRLGVARRRAKDSKNKVTAPPATPTAPVITPAPVAPVAPVAPIAPIANDNGPESHAA